MEGRAIAQGGDCGLPEGRRRLYIRSKLLDGFRGTESYSAVQESGFIDRKKGMHSAA